MFAQDSKGKTISGMLMSVSEDPNSRFRFEIWFDYTREIMNTLGEGAMVVVPNFYIDPDNKRREWSSVMEISTVLPVHYAISQNQTGFPGFLVEAAKSAGQDWIDQESESTDDTTKVRCIAIPTNIMLDENGNDRPEEGIPMVGHTANLLDSDMTEKLANLGIDRANDDVTMIGPLIRDEDVHIYLRVEEALKTHFAVFGFTGAGKSNLLSTFISQILERDKEKPPIKLVIFDLMSEFSILLMDLMVKLPHARLLAIGPETLPDSVLDYYAAENEQDKGARLPRAARDLMQTSLYPKYLKPHREKFVSAYESLLIDKKIRVWQEQQLTIGQFVSQHWDEIYKGSMGNSADAVSQLLSSIENDFKNDSFTEKSVEKVINKIIESSEGLTQTAVTNLRRLIRIIKQEAEVERVNSPDSCRVKIPDIAQRLNDEESSSLIIVQSADPDELRVFASNLGNALYENRRRTGQISPLVNFIFDEADEFIPLNYDKDSSYARSSGIAMTLARRGRKFGLGIGIATQRVTYLNTSIMAQPHTYLISKLPRKSDRERVCEAFGISEEMFRQTFKFKKGNWLLVSHDATGLDAVPLPIKTNNADTRIINWLDTAE